MAGPRLTLLWHSYLLLGVCGLLASLYPLPAALIALLLICAEKRLWHIQRLAIGLLVFCAAFFYASASGESAEKALAHPPDWLQSGAVRICGDVVSCRGLPDKRLRVLLENAAPPGLSPLPGYCAWTWEEPAATPLSGQKVCIERPVKPARGFANSENDGYESSLFAQKIYWRMWSKGDAGKPEITGEGNFGARMREDAIQAFLNILWPELANGVPMPQAGAILPALLFGDRQYLSQATVNDFANATLAHSLALSGQHLCLAGSLAFIFIWLGAWRAPGLYLYKPKRVLIVFASVPLALLYLWLGNFPPSLQRAAGMLLIGAFCFWRGIHASGLDLLCAALAIILISSPLAVFDAGLQMSALCAGIIIIGMPAISRFLPARKNSASLGKWQKFKRWAFQLLAISLLIQIALLPLSLARFQIAGFWFPLNLLWLPALGIIVLPFSALALCFALIPGVAFQWIASVLLAIATAPCEGLLKPLAWLRSCGLLGEPVFMLPHWTTLLAFGLLAIGLAAIMAEGARRAKRWPIALALCLFALAPALRFFGALDNGIKIEAFDVGQGQSILLRLPGDIRILVDGGGSYYGRFDPGKALVAPALCQNAPPRLAAVINSHPDMDHLGGLFYIIDKFEIGQLFHNGREARKENQEAWERTQARHKAAILKAGDQLIAGNQQIQMDILHPPEKSKAEGNAASLVLRLTRANQGIALLPGDSEKENLREILKSGADLSAKAVFAPHHGSNKNFLKAFYQASRPEVVIACCGYLNRWRYPGRDLRDWLAKAGISLLDTGRYGRIDVVIEADGEMAIASAKRPMPGLSGN